MGSTRRRKRQGVGFRRLDATRCLRVKKEIESESQVDADAKPSRWGEGRGKRWNCELARMRGCLNLFSGDESKEYSRGRKK